MGVSGPQVDLREDGDKKQAAKRKKSIDGSAGAQAHLAPLLRFSSAQLGYFVLSVLSCLVSEQ